MLADGSEYVGRYGLSMQQLIEFHAPRIEVLLEAGPDLLAIETIPSILEAEALVTILEGLAGVSAWISFSCSDGVHVSDGRRSPTRRSWPLHRRTSSRSA